MTPALLLYSELTCTTKCIVDTVYIYTQYPSHAETKYTNLLTP